MVEVFKTNVTDRAIAHQIVSQLHEHFRGCKANFDLEDCDLILRIQFPDENVWVQEVIALLQRAGFTAAVLTDDVAQPSFSM